MNKKTILLLIGGFVVLVIGWTIYDFITPKAYIELAVAPKEVTVLLNSSNKSVKNGDKIRVSPGDYKVIVSRDGFDSYVKDFSIKNRETIELLVALKPQTDEAEQLLLSDASQIIMQRFYGKNLHSQEENMLKNYPIVSILPIQARLYSISACRSQKYPDDITKIALCVKESQPNLQPYVLKDISSRGYNPKDYEIIWIAQYSAGE